VENREPVSDPRRDAILGAKRNCRPA